MEAHPTILNVSDDFCPGVLVRNQPLHVSPLCHEPAFLASARYASRSSAQVRAKELRDLKRT